MFIWKPAVCLNCTVYDCDFHISIIASQITGNWTVCSTPWSGYIKENIHAPYTSMKTSKLHIAGPCEENSLVCGFPSQRTSNSAHPLRWRHSVSNHQPHNCLLNRLFGCRSKKTSKLRVTGLCASKCFHPSSEMVPDSKVHGANIRPTWPGSCRPQVGPMLATWIFLSGATFAHTCTLKNI